MNLVLLEPTDFATSDQVLLKGRRHRHVFSVHRAQQGDILRVGLLNGPMGQGEVISIGENSVTMRVSLSEPPPAPLDLRLF